MEKVDSLFALIKSMTQHEKRYFKLFSSMQYPGKGKNYIVLFDTIDKLKAYDENKVKGKLKQEHFALYFAQEKRHLFLNIMKCLRQYHAELTVENKIASHLQDFRILYARGLVKESKKQLNKAKELGIKHERLHDLLYIKKVESSYLLSDKKTDEEGDKYLDDIISSLTGKVSIDKYLFKLLAYKKSDYFVPGYLEKSFKKLQVAVRKINPPKTSKLDLLAYYKSQGILQTLQGDFNEAIEFYKKIIVLFEGNSDLYVDDPTDYISILDNILYCCIKVNNYKLFHEYFNRLTSLKNQIKPASDNVSLSAYNLKLWYDINVGNVEHANSFMKVFSIKYEQLVPLKFSNLVEYDIDKLNVLLTSICYLGVRNHSRSLQYMEKYFAKPESSVFIWHAIVFNLLLHLDLNNTNLFKSALKKCKDTIKKYPPQTSFELLVAKFVKNLSKGVTDDPTEALNKFSKEVQKINNDSKTLLFNLPRWVDFIANKKSKLPEVLTKGLEFSL